MSPRRLRYLCAIVVLTLSVVCIGAFALAKTSDDVKFTVHEWGTFTSISGENGEAVPWRTYQQSADLPCFVYVGAFKELVPGSVRMETPVLYFYSSHATAVDVDVRFPNGLITEWYPRQSGNLPSNSLRWRGVRISPDAAADFQTDNKPSHYYAARATDAAPLQVGAQKERFLFYRGIGTFPLPISAKFIKGGKIQVKALGADGIESLILFENHGGKRRYQFIGGLQNEVSLSLSSLQSNWPGLLAKLERSLIQQGLYPKEARAMIETWRDSWFEEGTRILYIVPKRTVDAVVPLDIQPAPQQIARVFVGRMEVITDTIQDDVRQALAGNDRSALEKYGRFLEPIAQRIGARSPLLDSFYSSEAPAPANCATR